MEESRARWEWVPIVFALVKLCLHMLTSHGYGYFRDEFYYIACSEHLAWGYVDQPPLSIFLLWLQSAVLGDSLPALRFLPALAGAAVVYLTGRLARELGGGVWAQVLAMAAALAAPIYLGLNHYYSMNSFEMLFWTAATFQFLRVLKTPGTGNWIFLGVLLGLGLLNKISVLWLGAGIFAALLLTQHRRLFLTPGPWVCAALSGLLFSPYVIWNLKNDWAALEFMHNATAYKMAGLSISKFFTDQLLNLNITAAPLWICGLVVCFLNAYDSRLRSLAWIFVTVVGVLLSSQAVRSVYLAPAYPPLFAAGALAFERWQQKLRGVAPAYAAVILLSGGAFVPLALPVLPVDSYIELTRKLGLQPSTEERKEVGPLPQFYADMFGWPELAKQVATVFHSLSPEEQRKCRIFGENYGEAGAISFFGRQYSLPPAISNHNNYWLWGPGDYNGEVLIVIGGDAESKQELFEQYEQVAVTNCRYCMPYENNVPIYVCRRLKIPAAELWPQLKHYD